MFFLINIVRPIVNFEPVLYDTSHAVKTVKVTVNTDSESGCFDWGTKLYLAYADAYPEYNVISSTSGGGK